MPSQEHKNLKNTRTFPKNAESQAWKPKKHKDIPKKCWVKGMKTKKHKDIPKKNKETKALDSKSV